MQINIKLFCIRDFTKDLLLLRIIMRYNSYNLGIIKVIFLIFNKYTVDSLYKRVRHHKGVFTLYIFIPFIFYTFKFIYILSQFCFIYFVCFHILLCFYRLRYYTEIVPILLLYRYVKYNMGII